MMRLSNAVITGSFLTSNAVKDAALQVLLAAAFLAEK
jgi:hypothetical protein